MPKTLTVAEKLVRILDLLRDEGAMTARSIEDHLAMPSSTVYHYLDTMHDLGFVEKSGQNYLLSLNLLGYGQDARSYDTRYSTIKPYQRQLALATGHRVSYGVDRRGFRYLVSVEEGSRATSDISPLGERREMHLTATGKAILSQYDWNLVQEVVEDYDFDRYTPNTITSLEELREELEWIRKTGFAIENDEYSRHIRAVAVPLRFESTGEVGAISISGNKHQLSAENISGYADLLQKYKTIIEIDVEHGSEAFTR